jgi:TM2 domain-containing membrane protein YozV
MNNEAYNLELMSLFKGLPPAQLDGFINRFNAQARNPTAVFGFSVFLGSFGIDRFVLGQPLLGILKLITFGGLGIWTIVDYFLVAGIARERNVALARTIAQAP